MDICPILFSTELQSPPTMAVSFVHAMVTPSLPFNWLLQQGKGIPSFGPPFELQHPTTTSSCLFFFFSMNSTDWTATLFGKCCIINARRSEVRKVQLHLELRTIVHFSAFLLLSHRTYTSLPRFCCTKYDCRPANRPAAPQPHHHWMSCTILTHHNNTNHTLQMRSLIALKDEWNNMKSE